MLSKPILIIFLGLFLSVPAFGKQYWPTMEWKTSSPRSQDFDPRSISEMFEFIQKKTISNRRRRNSQKWVFDWRVLL